MKKFAFSLQRLLGYKEQMLQVERGILADMNAVLHGLEAERDSLTEQRAERVLRLREKSRAGMRIPEIKAHKSYLSALEASIEQKIQQIHLQQDVIDKQMERVREAMREISMLEKLKEHKLVAYNAAAQKAQELLLEEFISYAKTAEKSSKTEQKQAQV